jgi:flagellar basal body-associated protein FliL
MTIDFYKHLVYYYIDQNHPAFSNVKERKFMKLFLIVLAVIVVAGIGYYVYTNKESAVTPPTVEEPVEPAPTS